MGVVAILVAVSLALPVAVWRTGETPLPPLRHMAPERVPAGPMRVWVDTDAACGTGRHRDPDDCLALLSLAGTAHIDIAGVSTVFGNAPVSEVDRVVRTLVNAMAGDAGRAGSAAPPVFKGCGAAAPGCLDDEGSFDAQAALRLALQQGRLDVVALGPLTNLAAVLAREPGLALRINRVVAVMGRRPGHRFHPSENRAARAMLFGHGPVFRDLNAVLDPQAVSVVLGSGVPVVLVPYSAARQVVLTGSDLDRVARRGHAGTWVAERSRDWLGFWRSDVGLDGFYPFDLMAAVYASDPGLFSCARVTAWVGEDALLPSFGGGPALLVAQDDGLPTAATVTARVLYCDVTRVKGSGLFP